jgi:hypothetical protein
MSKPGNSEKASGPLAGMKVLDFCKLHSEGRTLPFRRPASHFFETRLK